MAKRGRPAGGESVSGYFRQIFLAHPELLDTKSNEAILERWKADHRATKVPTSVRSNLANLKSLLRKRRSQGLPLSPRTAPLLAARPVTLDLEMPVESIHNGGGLEALEEQIDESLTMARTLDRAGLEEVINLLRKARNSVVRKLED